jgi:hypothetical protein
MPKYRKLPVEIEAFQMTMETRWDNSDWPQWAHEAWNAGHGNPGGLFPAAQHFVEGGDELAIWTLEGIHLVSFGDWIIRGVKGELYPCKPDIFADTYEAVADNGEPGERA